MTSLPTSLPTSLLTDLLTESPDAPLTPPQPARPTPGKLVCARCLRPIVDGLEYRGAHRHFRDCLHDQELPVGAMLMRHAMAIKGFPRSPIVAFNFDFAQNPAVRDHEMARDAFIAIAGRRVR